MKFTNKNTDLIKSEYPLDYSIKSRFEKLQIEERNGQAIHVNLILYPNNRNGIGNEFYPFKKLKCNCILFGSQPENSVPYP